MWNQYFAPLKSLNFGLGGDRTQHVLWRVENGEIPLNAQTIVIHVGTNNTDRDDPKVQKSVGLFFKTGGVGNGYKTTLNDCTPFLYESIGVRYC